MPYRISKQREKRSENGMRSGVLQKIFIHLHTSSHLQIDVKMSTHVSQNGQLAKFSSQRLRKRNEAAAILLATTGCKSIRIL